MDFTEEEIGKKKIYTCGIISVTKKIVVGVAQGKRCTAELALEALNNALTIYGAPYMVMTDRVLHLQVKRSMTYCKKKEYFTVCHAHIRQYITDSSRHFGKV